MLTPQAALVYAMVVAAESDDDIAEREIDLIGDLVNHLPVFRGIDRASVAEMAMTCSAALGQPAGRERVLGEIRSALSPELRATAYALVCDVVAVDSRLHRSEIAVLDEMRAGLAVANDIARTIERAAQVRFQAA